MKLADAQHVIARDYGFASWPKLKEHVESLARVLEPAEMLSAAVRASDADKTAQVLEKPPRVEGSDQRTHGQLRRSACRPLLAAVQRSDRKTIDVLLRAGADINAQKPMVGRGHRRS